MWGESTSPGAPGPGPTEDTPTLDPTANTTIFPTVFGAGVTTTVDDPLRGMRGPDPSRPIGTADPLVGRLLDGRYQITERLARGGMATVYRGVDTRLTRTVAVKVMHVGLGDDAEFARKFDREARAAAKLSHPNVVAVFDQGRDIVEGHSSRPYIVMEHIDGRTLRDVINREAPLTPLRALEAIEPVLAALAAAHDAGLVHRDVKPENVLISDRGQVKVADFGLAKAISSQTSTATQGLLIGTVSYLPPELVVAGQADARSDVYSAGVVLFELLTGLKPHTGDTPIQVAYAHVHKDVPPPSTFPTAAPIPPYLDALVARATARNASARPQDAREFLTQVRRVESSLRQGLREDPELTEDLTAQPRPDAADFEVTQLVPAPVPAPVAAPRTVIDAPPPAPMPRPLTAPPPDRVAGQRERAARKRRRGWLAVLLVLMLTTIAALAGWYFTEGRFTSAPALSVAEPGRGRAGGHQVGPGHPLRRRVQREGPAGGGDQHRPGRRDQGHQGWPDRRAGLPRPGALLDAGRRRADPGSRGGGGAEGQSAGGQGQAQVQRDGAGGGGAQLVRALRRQPEAGRPDRPHRVPRTGADQDQELRRQAGGDGGAGPDQGRVQGGDHDRALRQDRQGPGDQPGSQVGQGNEGRRGHPDQVAWARCW